MRPLILVTAMLLLALAGAAPASHIPGLPCRECASHAHWPAIDGIIAKAPREQAVRYVGTPRSDELLGHFKSDRLFGRAGSDVLWGSWDGVRQPKTQRDHLSGGAGNDFIYGGHGHNTVYGGPGNDAISVHYGRGIVDCGAGRDIYHVARSRRSGYRFRNCETVDYRPERVRGGGLEPLD